MHSFLETDTETIFTSTPEEPEKVETVTTYESQNADTARQNAYKYLRRALGSMAVSAAAIPVSLLTTGIESGCALSLVAFGASVYFGRRSMDEAEQAGKFQQQYEEHQYKLRMSEREIVSPHATALSGFSSQA